MDTLRQVVEHTSDATMKGKLLGALAANFQGFDMSAAFDMTGAVVNLETFFLGDTKFQFQDISTAETATGSAAAATTNVITLNVAPDRDFIPDEIFLIDTEFCKVTSHVAGSLSVFCERGYAGSTAAVQSADVIQRTAAGGVTAANMALGYLVVPLVDLTQADADAKLVLAVPALSGYGCIETGTNDIVFTAPYASGHPANAEACTNATLANFSGGNDSVDVLRCTHLEGPIGDVANFVLYVPVGLTPVGVYIAQIDDSADAVITDNTYVIAGQRVTVTEGSTAWENTKDYVYVEVYCVAT